MGRLQYWNQNSSEPDRRTNLVYFLEVISKATAWNAWDRSKVHIYAFFLINFKELSRPSSLKWMCRTNFSFKFFRFKMRCQPPSHFVTCIRGLTNSPCSPGTEGSITPSLITSCTKDHKRGVSFIRLNPSCWGGEEKDKQTPATKSRMVWSPVRDRQKGRQSRKGHPRRSPGDLVGLTVNPNTSAFVLGSHACIHEGNRGLGLSLSGLLEHKKHELQVSCMASRKSGVLKLEKSFDSWEWSCSGRLCQGQSSLSFSTCSGWISERNLTAIAGQSLYLYASILQTPPQYHSQRENHLTDPLSSQQGRERTKKEQRIDHIVLWQICMFRCPSSCIHVQTLLNVSCTFQKELSGKGSSLESWPSCLNRTTTQPRSVQTEASNWPILQVVTPIKPVFLSAIFEDLESLISSFICTGFNPVALIGHLIPRVISLIWWKSCRTLNHLLIRAAHLEPIFSPSFSQASPSKSNLPNNSSSPLRSSNEDNSLPRCKLTET